MKLELDAAGYAKHLKNLQEQRLPDPKVRAIEALQVLSSDLPISDFIGLCAALCEQHAWLADQLKVVTVQEAIGGGGASKPKPKAPKPPTPRSSPSVTSTAAQVILDIVTAANEPMSKADILAAAAKAYPSLTKANLTTVFGLSLDRLGNGADLQRLQATYSQGGQGQNVKRSSRQMQMANQSQTGSERLEEKLP